MYYNLYEWCYVSNATYNLNKEGEKIMTSNYNIPDVLAPDLIIKNGKVITIDKDFSFADAVAVKDGKIVGVGTAEDVEALRGAPTKTLDLKGKTLIPGINDSHLHIILGLDSLPPRTYNFGPANVTSMADFRELVKEAVSKAKPGQWVRGIDYNQGAIKELSEGKKLCKEDIDDISPDNPVFIQEFGYHTGFANSVALKLGGIDKDTVAPKGGTIVKDENGEPTGLLLELSQELISELQPPPSYEEMREVFEMNISEITKFGITSVTSCNDRPYDINFFSNLYRDYTREGKPFPLRITSMMLWADTFTGGDLYHVRDAFKYVGVATGFGSDFLRIGGVKVVADGIPPQKTAWVSIPYEDGSHGSLILDGADDDAKVEHLNKIVDLCHAKGQQLCFHTSGDLAVKAAVEAFVRVLEEDPKDLRHYAIHGDWVLEESMDLMAEYNIPLNTQVDILYELGDDTTQRLGAEAAGNQWPLKQMLGKGVKFYNSSDWPVCVPDWRRGVKTAVTREARSGLVCGIHQAITLEEALRSYTVDPAWIDYMEDRKGSIEVGMLADFAVLGKDITEIDPREIVDTPVHMSIVGGNVIYDDGTLAVE